MQIKYKSPNPTQAACLRHQLVKLQQRLEDVNKVDEAILNILEDEGEIKQEIRDTTQVRDFIYDTIVTTELVVKRFEHKTMQPNMDVTVVSTFSTKIKWPTVALKRVDRDPCKWLTFWKRFCSAVHVCFLIQVNSIINLFYCYISIILNMVPYQSF